MGMVIAVASGKGGTGKTTTVAALSSCLAVLGYKTLCIDFDAGLKNLDLSMCMTDFAVMDYMDVINGRIDLMGACNESPRIPNLFFLAAPTVNAPDDSDISALRIMFDNIRRDFDYCLVDAPSGVGSGFKLAHCSADMSIIVTTGEFPSMRDAQRTASIVRDMGIDNIRLIVNRVLPKSFKLIKTNIDDVIDTVGARLIGVIPEDKYIFRALHANTPLVLYKKRHSAYDFLEVARRLSGEFVPMRRF